VLKDIYKKHFKIGPNMSNDKILTLLKNLEEASHLKGPKLQESFNNVAKELLTNSYSYDGVTFNISEIEFGCSALGDGIKGADAQSKMGQIYVHKTIKNEKYPGTKFLGMDITCGSDKNFGSILVRGVTVRGNQIKGPSECLRAILDHDEEGFEITKELSVKLQAMDEKPFFDLFQTTKIAVPREIKIGKRKSIKEHTPTEFHLRATCLSNPDGKNEMVAIG
jgi:hypothetical protein